MATEQINNLIDAMARGIRAGQAPLVAARSTGLRRAVWATLALGQRRGVIQLAVRQAKAPKQERDMEHPMTIGEWQAALDAALAEKQALQARLDALHEILTDPENQLEHTKMGYYVYRFDLETMHRIADAIGLVRVGPQPVLTFYTPEELPGLIRSDPPAARA